MSDPIKASNQRHVPETLSGLFRSAALGVKAQPVSYRQEALFHAFRRGPASTAQNVSLVCIIRGTVDAALARAAFDRIAERHIMLRTVYARYGAAVSQRAIEGASCDFQIVDARQCEGGVFNESVREESGRPFDLERGPVFRVRLFLRSEGEYGLLLCAHQIAADHTSLQVLLRDFKALYAALADGRTLQLPPLRSTYYDYARQQRQMMNDARWEASLEFWRPRLSGDTPVLDLPLDRRRPVETAGDHAALHFEVPGDLGRQIGSLAEREGKMPCSVYLTAYAILLSRYGGAENLLICSPATGRNTPELENVVGNFANPVMIAAGCAPHLTFQQLLGQVSATALEAHEHEDLPFPLLLEKLRVSRRDDRAHLCDVYYVWEEGDRSPGSVVEVPFEVVEAESEPVSGAFDLGLRMHGSGDRLQATLLYRRDLFEAVTIERMSRHFVRLLESVVSSPGTPIGELELMPDDERALVLSQYAGSDAEYPRRCLHELFAEHAALRPEAEALVFGNERLTYCELDRRSNQVARFLRAQGLGREELVGIFMEQSVDMIVSMVGILKAGGAYAPIDPKYPNERVDFMVKDMAARWILTHRQVHANLPNAGTLVYVDGPDSAIARTSDEAVSNVSTPESVAVLIYTSGSTGQPKGALIPHRAAVRTVRNTNYLHLTPRDRVAQVVSPSFDVCILEVWSALANGAALIGIPREILLVPSELAKVLRSERISVLILTTAYLHQVGRDAPDILKDVRTVLFGGEAAEPGPIRNILKHGPPLNLINAYGPTEAGIMTTYHKLVSIPEDARTVPIGRPVTNAQVYVLDSRMRPVPIGLPGEIYIGGEGVARGYRNRPELNAEKFLPDPFSRRPGALLYRTGDLARIRGNGDFEFIGRIDHQVKIRGYRIEIPEVQLALAAHPDVKHALVMVREDQPGNKRLVAYVTLRRDLPSAADALRHYVKSKLPPYMVPASFVVVDAIPLTTNGKVDRKALPPPHERPNITHVPPRTGLERVIARIWEELLGIDHVGLNDDFFDLGGHSLLAACLVARIEKHTGHNIPVATLFEAPTVGQLARKIDEGTYASAWSPLVELHHASGSAPTEPLFCLHSLGANLISYKKLASLLQVDRSIYGLQPHGLDGRQAPLDNIEEMAAAYLQEIRARQPAGPYHLSGICLGGVLAYEIAQQLLAAGEQVRFLLLIDAPMPGALQYLHTRSSLMQYLDRHLGEMLLLRPAARLRYLATWLGNGGIRLASALGWQRGEGSVARATEHVVEANLKAFLTYRPKPYAGKVTLFICSDSSSRSYEDRRLAWSAPAEGGLELHIVPGNHLSMVEEPHVRVMAQTLQRCLDRLDSPGRELEERSYATTTSCNRPVVSSSLRALSSPLTESGDLTPRSGVWSHRSVRPELVSDSGIAV